MRAGMVWGRERSVDSTAVEANAALDSLRPRFAVEAHLARLFAAAGGGETRGPAEAPQGKKAEADAPQALPVAPTEAARAALAERAAARHDSIGEPGRPNRDEASGPYRRTADFRASPTDPDASPPRPTEGRSRLSYRDHSVVDGGKARIVLAALVTPAEGQDNQPALDLLWRARFRWKLRARPRPRRGTAGRGAAPAPRGRTAPSCRRCCWWCRSGG